MRALVAGVLCVLVAGQPVVAAAAESKPAASTQQIQGEQRVLHALNRFTFGPRPGDVAAVQTIGLKRWFEQQLNSSSIDDSALDQRLEMFPAMKMSQAEMIRRYPSPQVLRQMIERNIPLPSDPVEHAIYADEIAFYKAARAKQEAKQAADAKANGETMSPAMTKDSEESKDKAALPGDGVDPAVPAMATHEEQFYSGLEAVKILNLPPDERIRRILAMPPSELIAFRKSLSQAELAEAAEGLSPMERETLAALQGSPRMIGAELLQSRMLRDVYSERQLEAVMTDFWLNHFNVYIKKNQNEPYMLPAYERETIRPHALGKFEDLLVATAKSPAMLMYLDNWQSIGPDSIAAKNGGRFAQYAQNPQVKQALKDRGLNENYARELMELHTLGVQCEVSADRPVNMLDKACGQGYTQQDVTQVAKVLTGWTIDQPFRSGGYQFEPRRHEPGTKTVLGKTIGESGESEGLQVLHMLAASPATAKFISTKLAVRFVSDTPPPTLVDRMAKAFLASNGDIKTVLRTMFDSPEFWSPEVYRAKMKTPEEFVVSAVRASGADVKNAIPLVQSLEKLGMPLYGMQTPNGYSWMAETWVNTGDLVSRMNFALGLSSDRIPGVQTDWTRLLGETGAGMAPVALKEGDAAAAKEAKLELLLLGQAVSDRTRSTVLQQFQNQGMQQQAEKDFSIRANDFEPMAQVLNPAALKPTGRPPLDREAAMMAGLLLGSPEFQRR
ncbi:MAG TPA: DUF1800 domain-containing protein [Edaphobacter sp.]|nr:DUF1800 domain-containing protein [Edaphobacter sp.]